MKLIQKRILTSLLAVSAIAALTACQTANAAPGDTAADGKQVVFYSNADEEAMTAMQNALNANGYEGNYLVQSIGTSELGGKLLAEAANIEADLVTMSSYYIDSAQTQNNMFLDLTFDHNTSSTAPVQAPSYSAPITAQEGAIIVNTELLASENLPMPTSIKDLANPVYSGSLSVTDISSSSTAWLLLQDIVSAYGTDTEGKDILKAIYTNAGDHIESSGSAPLKQVRAGEVAIGFGLRHQAVADKAEGLPIDYVDPAEGNFTLTESIAVINKGDKTNPLAMEMAECVIKNARKELLQNYPVPLYDGETADAANASGNPKVFDQALTVELLQQHQAFSEECKPQ